MIFNLSGKSYFKEEEKGEKKEQSVADEERRHDYFVVVGSCRNALNTVYKRPVLRPP